MCVVRFGLVWVGFVRISLKNYVFWSSLVWWS